MANLLFVAVTQNFWGVGPSVEAAEREMRKAGASVTHLKRCGYVVKQLPDGATAAGVDDFGGVFWEGAQGRTTLVKDTRKAAR